MNYLELLLKNEVFVTAAVAWFCAQVLKTITHLIVYKKLVLERLIGDGGMPSAHSATVSSLATATFFVLGPDSAEFAIAAFLAIIVMHDACGVRLETSKQTRVLKEMMEVIQNISNTSITPEEKLKEFVGHTKLQVFMGALLGIGIALLMH